MVVRSFSKNGGLELYTHRLVEGLTQNGLSVTVFCEQSDSDFNHANLKIENFSKPAPSLNKSRRLTHYLKVASLAVSQSAQFDIVHSQHFPVCGANVVTFHNHSVPHLTSCGRSWERALNFGKMHFNAAYRQRNEIDQMLAEKASVLIFPSHVLKQDFEASFRLTDKDISGRHIVAYPGVDSIVQQPPRTESATKSAFQNTVSQSVTTMTPPFTFLFVGKGFRKKGLDILFDACQTLIQQGYSFRLMIVGLKEKLLDSFRLSTSQLREHIFYLGFQKDMAQIYNQAQAIVMPSRLEPFGMAAGEAMIYGVVPIVTQTSGVAELLSRGKDALILQDELNHVELADLMASLIESPPLVSTLSEAARLTAGQITWDHTVAQTLSGYSQIASQTRQND